jgi:prephenate dehydrogenase
MRGLAREIVGIGRNSARLEAAREAGIIDRAAGAGETTLGPRDLAVVCTPVDRIVQDVRSLAEGAEEDATITDVGSVKGRICSEIAGDPTAAGLFVGSHPIAGSEQRGWEHATPTLFRDRVCVVTPTEGASRERVARLERFWQGLGMRVACLSPEEHDRALALTSHLPHAAAAALASLVSEREFEFVGTGFRDTTRIAMGDDEIWTPIFLENSPHVLAALDAYSESLGRLRAAIAARDEASIEAFLAEGQRRRRAIAARNA